MHIHFEKSINGKCDCTILSMSWMGKVPDELPEDEGWKLNRTHYYQEGWLATGNIRGILGVTFTTSHWRKNSSELPHRTNYNLRGHRAQITLVQWNEPYQKLASCDSSGIIFVWIKYEGRWSIELINDRSTPVTHFSWSHDGRMALICYQDGFVLVGSVAGQRYWSSMLNLEATIMCGIWTPDDQHVYFGTSNAQVIVMDVHGAMVSQVQLPVDSSIRAMAWSCEKFKMEENEDGEPSSSSHFSNRREPFLLAIAFKNGLIYLMKNYDDISPIQIWTGMQGLLMEWSNSGEYLAVAGSRPVEVINEAGFRVHEYFNSIYFYNHRGVRVLNIVIPATSSPVTALTWGHNDKRLFVATGKIIHVGWVSKRVASLQLLCRLAIYKSLSNKSCVAHLPLPLPVRALISSLHTQTIVSILPNPEDLREFVSHPPSGNLRLHCTMIRHEDDANQSPGTAYTLYLEYLGGLVPILKGKRTSKIRPEFVIFDPQNNEGTSFGILVRSGDKSSRHAPDIVTTMLNGRSSPARLGGDLAHSLMAFSDSSESEDVELCASPHMQRRRYRNRLRERERERQREREREWERSRNGGQPIIPDPATMVNPQQLVYNDVLPENLRLVAVTSNIWGTKFKIHGLAMSLPENLGSVTYKTSLLHLQPRQMTLVITELRDDIFLSSDNGMRASHFHDDDEEDFSVIVTNSAEAHNLIQGNDPFRAQASASASPGGTASVSHDLSANGGINRRNFESRILGPQKRFVQAKPLQDGTCPASPSLSSSSPPLPTLEDSDNGQEYTGDDPDEFPYVDLATNPDILQLRKTLQGMHNTSGSSCSSDKPFKSSLKAETIITQVQIERNDAEGPSGAAGGFRRNAIPEQGPSKASVSYHHRPLTMVTSRNSPSRKSWIQNESNDAITTNPSDNSKTPTLNNGSNYFNIRPTSNTPPIHVRRSLSASLLDSVEPVGQLTLDIVSQDLRENTQPKRLVLIKKKKSDASDGGAGSGKTVNGKPLLKEWGKSKSWDSYDLSWWKKIHMNKTTANHGDNSTCPKCSYPSGTKGFGCPGESKRETLILGATATPRPSRCTRFLVEQGTPAKRRLYGGPKEKILSKLTSNRNTAQEDKIESAGSDTAEQICSPVNVNLAVPQPGVPSDGGKSKTSCSVTPPVTPTPAHRRSISLLTPLLKRRELAKSQPKSSSFIPPGSPQHQARSSPSTPATARKSKASSYLSTASSPFRQLFANSPLLSRRRRQSSSSTQDKQVNVTPKQRRKQWNRETQTGGGSSLMFDSSDDEVTEELHMPPSSPMPSSTGIHGHCPGNSSLSRIGKTPSHRLMRPGTSTASTAQASMASPNDPNSTPSSTNASQRSQLRQKLSKKKIHNIENSPVVPRRMEFVMHNKAPMWNENSQVYQLDFGGRVTQESAKNFQIEFRNKQVMQFGRIDGNAYTMDFQYPFSALQAFAVALANVTQRLK